MMKFSLIICTYKRKQALLKLLLSVESQNIYPDEIIIVDGSADNETQIMLDENQFKNLRYCKVAPGQRGLTKQRNIGISQVSAVADIVFFLDDDTILNQDYFENILKSYTLFPKALGVGGYISNEISWKLVGENFIEKENDFTYDGWKRNDGKGIVWRKKLGLDSDCPPGFSPLFSHGRSIGFLPPSGKIYPVEQLMGGVSSFKKSGICKWQHGIGRYRI